MAVHTVGSSGGRIGRAISQFTALPAAIASAQPGDRINVGSGDFLLSQTVKGLEIVGDSTATTSLSGGQITFEGASVLANCTIKCTRVSTQPLAFRIVSQGSVLALHNVVVDAPSRMRPNHPDVLIGPGTAAWAYGCSLGRVVVDRGTLHLSPSSSVTELSTVNGGTVVQVAEIGGGATTNRTAIPGSHATSGNPGAVQPPPIANRPQAPTPLAPAQPTSGRPDLSSYVEKVKSRLPGKSSASENPVNGPAPNRMNVQIGTVRGRVDPKTHRGRILQWPSGDGQSYDTLIKPNLAAGDTLLLEPGEYWIPSLYFDALSIEGTGDPSQTVLHLEGPVGPSQRGRLTLSNMTVRPAFGKSALAVGGGQLNLVNVVVDHVNAVDEPIGSVLLMDGRVTLTQCEVRADRFDGAGEIHVRDSAHLHAANSALGFLNVQRRGVAEVNDCSAYALVASTDGEIRSAGVLSIVDGANVNIPDESEPTRLSEITVVQGGRVVAEQVVSQRRETRLLAKLDASIDVGYLHLPDHGHAVVTTEEGGSAAVRGDDKRIRRVEEDHQSIDSNEVESLDELFTQLNAMVGLEPVKKWVRGLANRVEFDKQEAESGETLEKPNYHMVFYGSPGTGKTTVARLIGKILFRLDVLPTTNYAEVDRGKIVGKWQAETEEKTEALIEQAMGGVLFVDEAYQLVREKLGTEDIGVHAIDTLLTALENHRGDFVAIFAGYTEPMDRFLDANPGLRSRLRDRNRIEFPDYSPTDVGRIAANILVSGKWIIDTPATVELVARKYSSLREDEKGNGRSARNFAETIIEAQKEYVIQHKVPPEHRRRITPQFTEWALETG